MWHYVQFFIHLRGKDRASYSSHEQYVFDCLENKKLSMFPVNRALVLEAHAAAEEAAEEEKLVTLERKVGTVLRYLEETSMQQQQMELARLKSVLRRSSTA
jgi:hypothetical protein